MIQSKDLCILLVLMMFMRRTLHEALPIANVLLDAGGRVIRVILSTTQ